MWLWTWHRHGEPRHDGGSRQHRMRMQLPVRLQTRPVAVHRHMHERVHSHRTHAGGWAWSLARRSTLAAPKLCNCHGGRCVQCPSAAVAQSKNPPPVSLDPVLNTFPLDTSLACEGGLCCTCVPGGGYLPESNLTAAPHFAYTLCVHLAFDSKPAKLCHPTCPFHQAWEHLFGCPADKRPRWRRALATEPFGMAAAAAPALMVHLRAAEGGDGDGDGCEACIAVCVRDTRLLEAASEYFAAQLRFLGSQEDAALNALGGGGGNSRGCNDGGDGDGGSDGKREEGYAKRVIHACTGTVRLCLSLVELLVQSECALCWLPLWCSLTVLFAALLLRSMVDVDGGGEP
eukprot:365743-Chlamydomonas_euryale.AAC.14